MLKSANVTIMVSDMERAIAFYRDTLGFAITFRAQNEWAQLDAAGVTLALHPSAGREIPPLARQGVSLGFQVDHLEQAMAALQGKGVAFAPGIREDHGVRLAFFADPDGTPLYLAQPLWIPQSGWD